MAPSLETERLRLRTWTLNDVEAAFAIYSDSEVTRFFLAPPTISLEEQRAKLERVIQRFKEMGEEFGYWAIEEKATGEVVGAILLNPLPGHEEIEVGWHLARRAWGKGYATEGGQAGLAYGFDTMGLKRIVAVVASGNVKSQNVALRLGMQHTGRIHAYEQELEFFVLERN